jgi:hypothetical protein
MEETMAETCYSKGKKILLSPEQKRNGTWICRFTIPGLTDSILRRRHDEALPAYKSELEAKTAAFAAAKQLLEARVAETTDPTPR